MWRLSDPGTIEVLANSFAQNQLFIADGHHRYEAALRFRSRIRSEREVDPGESINYRMMMLVSVSEPGLVTRGYHRTIQNASDSELSDDYVVAAGADYADEVGSPETRARPRNLPTAWPI